jgi:ubiquinone biosynthesis protein
MGRRLRLLRTATILASTALPPLWRALPPGRRARALFDLLRTGADTHSSSDAWFAAVLTRLGPIFTRFGASMAARPATLSRETSLELAALRLRLLPVAPGDVRRIVERELGRPLQAVFSSFDLQPVHDGWATQVYFATVRDGRYGGREVAVKVLRPGVRKLVADDGPPLIAVCRWLERRWQPARRWQISALCAEFLMHLGDELDLRREASNMSAMRARALQDSGGDDATLVAPEVFWDLTTEQVFVMERMQGLPLNEIDALERAGFDPAALARTMVAIFLRQALGHGLFHADMHPSNLMVSTAPTTHGRLVALDFGTVGTLTPIERSLLSRSLLALSDHGFRQTAMLWSDAGLVPSATRREAFESALRAACEPHLSLTDAASPGGLLSRLANTARGFEASYRSQFGLLHANLDSVEKFARALNPRLDTLALARPLLADWVRREHSPQAVLHELGEEIPRWAHALPALPRLAHGWLEQLQRHSLTLALHARAAPRSPAPQATPALFRHATRPGGAVPAGGQGRLTHWGMLAFTALLGGALGAMLRLFFLPP